MVVDRLAKFNVAVAEVAHPDVWRRAGLGIVTISSSAAHAEQQLAAVWRKSTGVSRVGLARPPNFSSSVLVCHHASRLPSRRRRQIREELSGMLAGGQVHDHDVGTITLTRVRCRQTSSWPACAHDDG
jgi:hypothetical protein